MSASSQDNAATVADQYGERAATLVRLEQMLLERSRWLGRARGATFLLAAGLALIGWTTGVYSQALYLCGGLAFVGFVAVVGWHEAIDRQLAVARERRRWQEFQLARQRRDWDQVPVPSIDVAPDFQQRTTDLDLFGKGSLFHLVCNAHTPAGRQCLRDWLLHIPPVDDILARQQAVSRLTGEDMLREELALHGTMLAASDAGPEALRAWAMGPTWFGQRGWLRILVGGLSAAAVGLAVAIGAQWVPANWILGSFVLIAINVVVNVVFAGSVHDLFNRITAGRDEIEHYAVLFRLTSDLPQDAPGRLQALARAMGGAGTVPFNVVLRRLRRIMRLASGRRSALFGIPWLFAQIFVLWDFHVLAWLERWQRQHGAQIGSWLDAVGELEALASLATVAHDHPDWAYPDVSDASPQKLVADSLGHPLLPPQDCVRNDVAIGPPGTFLLVTGSNMSGKSTLLRAVGVNVALAQAGSVVCSRTLRLPRLRVETSMRIRDSIVDGVSFFMAELLRLKEIVDLADRMDVEQDPTLLYLFDEILQGTNSAERHIAVARVIGHLTEQRTLGLVSTHDLQLATAAELQACCEPVHFRESFVEQDGRQRMTFDYRCRSGVAPTTNALQLLRMVGLDDTAPRGDAG